MERQIITREKLQMSRYENNHICATHLSLKKCENNLNLTKKIQKDSRLQRMLLQGAS